VFGMKDRGQLRAGAFADVLIFDLAKVNDAATYEKPHQLAEGMTDVIVNGELARRDGRLTTPLVGRVLRPGRQQPTHWAISSTGSSISYSTPGPTAHTLY
jgi:N-acyl-D-aspartate/D-glutamate deacylase